MAGYFPDFVEFFPKTAPFHGSKGRGSWNRFTRKGPRRCSVPGCEEEGGQVPHEEARVHCAARWLRDNPKYVGPTAGVQPAVPDKEKSQQVRPLKACPECGESTQFHVHSVCPDTLGPTLRVSILKRTVARAKALPVRIVKRQHQRELEGLVELNRLVTWAEREWEAA